MATMSGLPKEKVKTRSLKSSFFGALFPIQTAFSKQVQDPERVALHLKRRRQEKGGKKKNRQCLGVLISNV